MTKEVLDTTDVSMIDQSTEETTSVLKINPESVFTASLVDTVRIIYNPYSIDSCLATTIAIERIKEYNKNASVETVSHETFHYCNSQCFQRNTLMFMGVPMSTTDYLKEIEKCTPLRVFNFKYMDFVDATETPFDPTDGQMQYREITPVKNSYVDGSATSFNIEDIAENCISMLVNDFLLGHELGKPCTDPQQRLIAIVCRYVNMGKFDSIFLKDSTGKITKSYNDDLAFLYKNIEGIKKAAYTAKPHYVNMFGAEQTSDYTYPLKQVRDIIHRNMVNRIYHTPKTWCQIPTVCVSEENAIEVMRQMSHSLPTAISYEDIQYFRIWRIYTTDNKVIEHLRDVIKPIHSWIACKIHYLVSDNQIITKQIY